MTYSDRKLAALCVEKGCPRTPLEDNNRCRGCRDAHRVRNRRWKTGWIARLRCGSVVAA